MPNDVVPRRPNRLIHEASPYLRQHASNPVDWYPWGPEALERAREEDRPIFLSVGYSACHWCHVMAHECFEDEAIARKLNEAFVCVKVDREERPDVDQAYQVVCQALTGQGGWPLTVVLTPDLQPFYAGTYVPPAPRYGRPGLPQVIEACARAYEERPEEVRRHAARLADAVRHALDPWGTAERDGAGGVSPGQTEGSSPERGPQARVLVVAADRLLRDADERAGGFRRAPKFPQPAALDLLARAAWRHGHRGALEHLERTLVWMTRGGIFDQVGGGFHRYAVDRWWKVPHFEKMLYDNALLLPLLVQLGLWCRPELLEAAARTCDFLLDEMRLKGGGFAASLDADSPDEEGRPAEGAFYRWHPHELVEALGGKELAARVGEALAIRSGDAAQDESLASRIGQLALDAPPGWAEEAPAVPGALPWEPGEAAAAATGRDDGSLREALGRMAAYRRERRRPPARDEKVIAGWHALALSALVWEFRAGLARTREPQRYLDAAREGFAFVEEHLLDGGGSWLLHTPRRGAGAVLGYCDDYAWTVHAALDLFTATQERAYLHRAQELMHAAGQRFREGGHGLYFLSGAEHASPLGRARDIWDQATPSANAAVAAAHARLGAILDSPEHRAAGMEVVEAAWPMMLQHVSGTAGLWCALDRLDGGMATVTLRSRHLDEVRADLQRLLALPHPALDARWEPAEGVPSFLVCVGSTCDLPRESVEEALARLAPAPRVSHP